MDEIEAKLEALHPASFAWSVACCRGDAEEARDVLQTVYLQILDGRARFGGRSSLKTWVFAVIRRTADGRRRQRFRRLRRIAERRRELEPDPPAPDPERGTALSQRARRLRAALARLSRRQREVLELVFYHELTVVEAAGVMGVSAGSARVHYDRGKKALRALLDEGTNGGDDA